MEKIISIVFNATKSIELNWNDWKAMDQATTSVKVYFYD